MPLSTIAAISTPPGTGGIGILKISGLRAAEIGLSLFRPNTAAGSTAHAGNPFPVPRYMYYGRIIHPHTGAVIDEALWVYMSAPHTYTGEDVVELQCHGGPLVMQVLLSLVIAAGARIAEPGEFTRRAFLNGRIDLSQAEAVIDLINAKTLRSMEMGAAHLSGQLGEALSGIRVILQDILVELEADIDFPEDMEGAYDPAKFTLLLQESVFPVIHRLIESHESMHCLRDGIRVVIAGSPNVGKSSLLNRLVERERAIVTDTPGTTRDFIEDVFTLQGLPIVLTDTAGLHDSIDPIEKLGIDRAWQAAQSADLLLFVIDAGRGVSASEISLLKSLPDRNRVLVINKIDLLSPEHACPLPFDWQKIPKVEISALHGTGIGRLKTLMTSIITGPIPDMDDPIVPNVRQKIALDACFRSLTHFADGIAACAPPELLSIDLNSALQSLAEISGQSVSFDVLDAIFNQFCIGK